jgi:hypothetical protein
LGSRALFAFQIGETEEFVALDGTIKRAPTENALLGALMRWEERNAIISFVEAFDAFLRALSKPSK